MVLLLCLSIAAIYAYSADEWYRAEAILAPADDQVQPNVVNQLGGLVGLAGFSSGSPRIAEPIAVLQSRQFVRGFIQEYDLLPVLIANRAGGWLNWLTGQGPEKVPDMRDAVSLFRDELMEVNTDSDTGLVRLQITWIDPELAAEWVSLLIERLNSEMRQRAFAQANENVAFLRSELRRANLVAVQQSLSRLLETELQKVMLARGETEFSFRVIDSAEPPKYKSKPNRGQIIVLAAILGSLLGSLIVLARKTLASQAGIDRAAAE